MAKVYFRYAAMNAGKSTQLLQVRHNYHERHQRTLLLKPELDNRDGVGLIRPRIGGLEVLSALRADPATRDIPVMLLTGLSGDEDIVRGVQAGASMYVTKPVDSARLLALLSGMVPRS